MAAPIDEETNVSSILHLAISKYNSGQLFEAERLCRQIRAIGHKSFDALHLLGIIQSRLGQHAKALRNYDRALSLRPDSVEAISNRGNALFELKRFEEALASHETALLRNPDYVEAHFNRGLVLFALGRFSDAIASYDDALARRPNDVPALLNRAHTLDAIGRFDEALATFDKALAIQPDFAEVLCGRGNTLKKLDRLPESLASYDRAIAARPDFAEAICNRGIVLDAMRRPEDALQSYARALTMRPDFAEAHYNRGITLHGMGRFDEALLSFDRTIALRPNYSDALTARGHTLKELKRFEQALASFERARLLNPDHKDLFSEVADCTINICDWRQAVDVARRAASHVRAQTSNIAPFTLFSLVDDPALHLQCARGFTVNKILSSRRAAPRLATKWHHDKVRLAYLSADFCQHATAYLTAELFELHDRSKFEVLGVSFGVDDRSATRKRLTAAFDRFYDVNRKTNTGIIKMLHDLKVDIAIDLKGYTLGMRAEIFFHRAAPIQVNYLGFPGTMGADFIDYIIADRIVAPTEHQAFFAEKIVHLPDCYQVNDRKRKISERTPTRQQAGLPDAGFVFCCFNNNWKIRPEVFDIWMRLLRQVDGSVLWLLSDNVAAERNLRREAKARGIAPERLVFAPRLSSEDHLARHQLADLFIDTLPYNAHTTASDALWTGLPLLTRRGESFAGRVAASLLNAVGLGDLVTHSGEEYESLALRLANDPSLLQSYRNQLAANRLTHPLFDTDRFRCHIEAAYLRMFELWQAGEPARSFAVDATP